MDTLSYKTVSPGEHQVEHNWVVIDATDQILGRLCSKVAKILRGKNKPSYTPYTMCGDNVIIVNADKVKLTGNKWTDHVSYRYTGYPGGQREVTPALLRQKALNPRLKAGKNPLFIKVVKGMLPKNRLGRRLINNLYVYNGPNHPLEDKNPTVLDINKMK